MDLDLLGREQSHVFEEQGGHALALSGWRSRILPESGKVGGQVTDLLAVGGVEGLATLRGDKDWLDALITVLKIR